MDISRRIGITSFAFYDMDIFEIVDLLAKHGFGMEVHPNDFDAEIGDPRPTTAVMGRGRAALNFNRLVVEEGVGKIVHEYRPGVTEGPCDPELIVLRFQRKDGTEALSVHYTGRSVPIPEPVIAFGSKTLSFLHRADPRLKVEGELSCLVLGHAVMGFVPGELFVEFQLAFKRELQP